MSTEEILKRKLEDSPNVENSKKQKIEGDVIDSVEPTNRIRKPKKVVLVLCYLGKDYFGMQRNNNVSTVEESLLNALLKANIIQQNEFESPKVMKFQRAARTDKGVSAGRQVVSLKIPTNEITDTFQEKVNEYLPPEIRVLGVIRVTQSFDAKNACDARTYSYMLPTFAFSDGDDENREQYRITGERIEQVNKFLQRYQGTHNYYNFTSGRLPGDPSCKRYIISFECGSPFLLCGLEFVTMQVKGQSFMLHQIRKMVGLAIAFMRGLADESVLTKSWLNERLDIPKAPGLGLMLENLHYDWYNKKYGSDGLHEPLIWDKYDDVVNKFKTDQILLNMAKTEREEKSMIQWLETLPHHSFDVREAGPPELLPVKEPAQETANNGLPPLESTSSDCDLVKETRGGPSSDTIVESSILRAVLTDTEYVDKNAENVIANKDC